GAGLRVGELCLHFGRVLAQCIASGGRTVEPDATLVGLVIIYRGPVGTWFVFYPRPRAVVVAPPHKVVQAEWRHVVYRSFARMHHHRQYGIDKRRIIPKRAA